MQQVPFRVAETHGILVRPGPTILASSDGHGWHSLYASEQREVPFEGVFPAVADQLLVLHLDGPVALDTFRNAAPVRRYVPAGGIHMFPGGEDFAIRLHKQLHTLHVYLRRSVIEAVARDVVHGDPADVFIAPRLIDNEPTLTALLGAIRPALVETDIGLPLYVDYLAQAMACHLLRHYSGARLRQPRRRHENGGEVVKTAIEYMRAHIDAKITLDDLALAAGASGSLIYKYFRVETGLPPHRYLMELRLAKAHHMLTTSQVRIAEIAFDCGFANQEHLARLFRRQYGLTPSEARRAG